MMETSALALTTPAVPKDTVQATQSAEQPGETAPDGGDFAAALEQQIAQGLPMTAFPGITVAVERQADAPAAAAEQKKPAPGEAPTTPDSIIALISAPLLLQPQPQTQPQPQMQMQPQAPALEPRPAHLGTSIAVTDRMGTQQPAPAATDEPLRAAREPAHGHTEGVEAIAHADKRAEAQPAERERLPATHFQQPDATLFATPATSAPIAQSTHAAPASVQADRQIAATVGSADWNDGFAQQVTLVVKDGEQTAQLRLDPPDLGPLEVRVTMGSERDGVAHAHFVSAHASVRDAIESALPQLRAVLAESGITLGQASVGDGFVRDDARHAASGTSPRGREGGNDDPVSAAAPAQAITRRGLVDIFA